MARGIIVTRTLDKKYFEVGSAFRFRIGTNNFKHSILTEFNEDYVVFTYLEKGKLEELKLTINDLRFHNYDMVKLKPDYEKGKFMEQVDL